MAWLQITGILLLFQRTSAQLTPQKYHLISGSLTWHEAQSFCRVKYSDLATVNNMADKNELVKTLGGHVTYSWIGLQRGGIRRWMWSDGSGTAHFTVWDDKEPNNIVGGEGCAEISQTGSWNDLPCRDKKGYVCYDRQEGGKRKFVYYSEKQSWPNSLELCRRKHTDLACVHTTGENSEVANLVKSWTGLIWMPNKAWFGLFSDAWMWSDGSESSFRSWLSSAQDQGNCALVAVPQQGRWVDAHCNVKATFVCQGGLKVKMTVIRMKVHSVANVTDSRVSDALLKQFETGLKLQRATDFNLSWRSDKNGFIFQRREKLEAAEKTG